MLTILYLYYNQPQAIEFFETLGYPQAPVNFLFVDDGSATPLQLNWPNAQVLRIEEDIPWNQPSANNLAFNHLLQKYGLDATVLRMDIDHYFNLEDIPDLQHDANAMLPKEIIHYRRQHTTPHPNIYMARVIDLVKAGGYSEAFCGNYGYDDKEFMHRLKKRFFSFSQSTVVCNVNHSGRTHKLNRDKTINYNKYLNLIK